MCGIALIVDRAGAGVDPARLAAMTGALASRGPDDEAFLLGDGRTGTADWFGGAATDPSAPLPALPQGRRSDRWSLGLGVRRLAIRDVHPRARQPMRSRRGLWLAFNGELYNAEAIRDELGAAGHAFRTAGDTEVFLAAWDAWGPDALARLSGMWAFVVWDAPRHRLWCGRDPLGIKPLYLARTPAGVLVASTPGAIVAGLGARPAPHAPAMAEYLATGLLDHAPPTCFTGIDRVGAGCLIEIDESGGIAERRWAPALTAIAAGGDRQARFHDALDRAIASHRASDRPIGALLSGGLDSATIALSAAAADAAPLSLFTAGFADAACDERAVAASIAARTPFPWHVAVVGEPPQGVTLADDLSTYLAGLDEPVVSSSAYAQWCVMRRVAAAGIRVVLDGQGADELLCGYPALVGPALADDVLGGGPGRAWAALDARAGKGEGSAPAWRRAARSRSCRRRSRSPPAGSRRRTPPRSIPSWRPAGTRRRRRCRLAPGPLVRARGSPPPGRVSSRCTCRRCCATSIAARWPGRSRRGCRSSIATSWPPAWPSRATTCGGTAGRSGCCAIRGGRACPTRSGWRRVSGPSPRPRRRGGGVRCGPGWATCWHRRRLPTRACSRRRPSPAPSTCSIAAAAPARSCGAGPTSRGG